MSTAPTSSASLWRRALLGLTLPLILALAACGGGAGTDAGGDFGVKIKHKYGTTTIDKKPSKVVALGLNDADTLLALGIQPVGVVDWFGERPYGAWPWAKELWKGKKPKIVGERDDYNMEKIAKLAPDLIVAQYSGMTKDQYKTLSKWAPVVAQPLGHEDYAAPWQAMAEPIAKAVGEEKKLDKLIDGIEDDFAAVREEHPEFGKLTAAVSEGYEKGKYVAFAADDPKMEFMTLLGFKPDDKIESEIEKGNNVVEFGSERLDLVDVDLLVWLTADEAAAKNVKNDKVYSELDVVKDGRDLFVPYEEGPKIGAAMSFNTVLSIPYAIEELVPQLEKKAKA
ncbi:ABC transporter substrate-binding protein [Stackebrandtia nassauensis]|uniref:Periplasmic binding protein n=1 Tax=Stackebrandtia nassauensis (strain DSM 44728 / CIP 108903 / NRRL B-16338 / NBRC 102104 / LLR-40K-21) TaxID=446470 RepID=D3PUU7_STANL|nr:ABC transporter substrate-binding protein [Stackebrandtia nassauensis]ADD44971.1 periplasmic binding protein [Stackebrandtia nassauensis DSM 44728]